MTRILLTGHGHWASGLLSGLAMVAGDNSAIQAADFDGDTAKLAADIARAASQPGGLLVFCDLAGGTPFQVAAMTCRKRPDTRIIAGASQPMLLEIALMLDREAAELSRIAQEAGKAGIRELVLARPE